MAKEKFNAGDTVRLKKNISFGTIHIRANTVGVIKLIKSKMFGDNEYEIRWRGTDTDVTMKGTKHFVLASDIGGQVFKG